MSHLRCITGKMVCNQNASHVEQIDCDEDLRCPECGSCMIVEGDWEICTFSVCGYERHRS